MTDCGTLYGRSRCTRPAGHDEGHGPIRTTRSLVRRPLAEYADLRQPNGRPVLDAYGYEAIAEATTQHRTPDYIAVAETRREDGYLFVEIGATTAYIERVTDYRLHDSTHRLRPYCGECGRWGAGHAKSCSRA